jgi:hypothetical protein
MQQFDSSLADQIVELRRKSLIPKRFRCRTSSPPRLGSMRRITSRQRSPIFAKVQETMSNVQLPLAFGALSVVYMSFFLY